MLEIDRPRSAFQLIGATFTLYRRFPLLFLILAGAVVVPYEVIVLLLTGSGPLAIGHENFLFGQAVLLVDLAVITPLIAALHIHAVREIGDGNRPQLIAVGKKGIVALPAVGAAVLISWLGIFAGTLALIVPGVLLFLRWSVVAQAAAMEGKGWRNALDRSRVLTLGHYWHIFALFLMVEVATFTPGFALGLAFGHTTTTAASFLADLALQVLVRSFFALASALLFFDLSARFEVEGGRPLVEPGPGQGVAASGRSIPPTDHPLDPRSYSDEDRPSGWYIDPEFPRLMYYWAADGTATWGKRSSRTPKDTLAEWFKYRKRAEEGRPPVESGPGRDNGNPGQTVEPTGHPLDPASYSDEDRPAGWYVNPDAPWRMRYWAADGNLGWSKRTAKTPKKTLAEWRDLRWTR